MGTDIGREFEEYQRSSYTEKLREQLARLAEEMMVPLAPVVICVSRANGRTEMLRRSGVYRDLRSGKLVDLEAQGEAQCEELRRLHELMEPVVQSLAEPRFPTAFTVESLEEIQALMDDQRLTEFAYKQRAAERIWAILNGPYENFRSDRRAPVVLVEDGPSLRMFCRRWPTPPPHEELTIDTVMSAEEIRGILGDFAPSVSEADSSPMRGTGEPWGNGT